MNGYEDLNHLTYLHEFGHLAGLTHENERPEIEEEIGCKISAATYQGYFKKEDLLLYPYDSHSIMSYCENDRMKQKGNLDGVSLSPLDSQSLKSVYSHLPALKAQH